MHRWTGFVLMASAIAQSQPLNPTSNLTLDTNATQGHFAFSFIDIPVGVRVTFTGVFPVQIRCEGDAVIRGQLDVDAAGNFSGPGAVATGTGTTGHIYFGNWCFSPTVPPGPGQHAGLYGSAQPFDLAGGSPGGRWYLYGQPHPGPVCAQLGGLIYGGGGGGTLVLEAEGAIDIHGRVSANGAAVPVSFSPDTSVGSGGSILLRGLTGVNVHASGIVQATAEPNPQNISPPGIVRVDAYGQAPVLSGTVDPPPLALELPFLEETQPFAIGNTWELRAAAPRGNGVTLGASFVPGSTTNQFGTIGVHLPTAILFTFLPLPSTGHDPLATYQLAIPNDPGLVGLSLYIAGLDWLTTLPPRYTNTIHTVVQ